MLAALAALAACGRDAGRPPPTSAPGDAGRTATAPARADAAPAVAIAPDAAGPAGDAGAVDSGLATRRPSPRCRGLPADGTVEPLPAHDDTAGFLVRGAGDARWLVFDGRDRCEVVPVGRADARVHGRLWPGADEVKAFVLRGPACDGDDDATCPAYLAIRDDTGTFFDAVPTCAATDQASLDVVSIFDDGPSLLVTCASLTGFGLDSDLALVHPVDGALRVVLQTRGGWGDHAPGECATPCATSCWTLLDEAHWRVIARGAAPVIETIAPIAYMERADRMVEPDTRITPNRLRWRYQPDRRRFEVERRDVDETIAIPDACAPRPLRAPLRPSR